MRFLAHPVVLIFCGAPLIILITFYGYFYPFLKRDVRIHRLFLLFLLYSLANTVMYFLYHPAIYQRYMIVFFPASVLLIAHVLGSANGLKAIHKTLVLSIAGISLIVLNIQAIDYYAVGARLNFSVVQTLKSHEALTKKGCRIAAEPLGFAAYFTSCYVIDTGGLINPDIWEYWKNGKSGRDYAKDRGAQYNLDADKLTVLLKD